MVTILSQKRRWWCKRFKNLVSEMLRLGSTGNTGALASREEDPGHLCQEGVEKSEIRVKKSEIRVEKSEVKVICRDKAS